MVHVAPTRAIPIDPIPRNLLFKHLKISKAAYLGTPWLRREPEVQGQPWYIPDTCTVCATNVWRDDGSHAI